MQRDPERVFLHDMASPLTALQLVLSNLTEDLAGQPELSEQARTAFELAERLTRMLQARREVLRAAGPDAGPTL
jgi:hypothetical protein